MIPDDDHGRYNILKLLSEEKWITISFEKPFHRRGFFGFIKRLQELVKKWWMK